jgi:hypothetical protein
LFPLFATGVNDTSGKFAAVAIDTAGNLPPVLLTPVANLPMVFFAPQLNVKKQKIKFIFDISYEHQRLTKVVAVGL